MPESFQARIGGEGEGALPEGAVPMIEVPSQVVERLGPGKRPKVVVSLNGYSYRSTVAVYGGQYYLPMNKQNQAGAAVRLGDRLEVTLELDTATREVELPTDLARALAGDPQAGAAFGRLSYTARLEHAQALTSAKQEETRRRRLEKILAKL